MRDVETQVFAIYIRHYMGSAARLSPLLDVTRPGMANWLRGEGRPRANTLVRMCRLLMWGGARWPDEARIEWTAMRVQPAGMPDPFALSESVRFGYGGPRDRGALLRDSMARLGLDRKAHMGRLLGCPDKWTYQYVWNWMSGRRRVSPRYLVRLLALLLWDWRGYPVNDMWAVHWSARTVEWSWDGNSGAPTPLPGSPFDWMKSAGRPGRLPSYRRLAVDPKPVAKQVYAYA